MSRTHEPMLDWQPTDDAIRAALTPASSIRMPFDLGEAVRAEIAVTQQRPGATGLGSWHLVPERRRAFVIALALVGLLIAALAIAAGTRRTPSLLSDVPTYHGNPARTGVMPGPGPAGTSAPAIAWQTQLGAPVGGNPAVTAGTVYVGDASGNVHGLREATGEILWSTPVGSALFDGVAVAGGRIFVGTDDGGIAALDATTGTPLWQLGTGGPVRSSPLVVDGVVYAGGTDATVYAVDAETGTRRWATPVPGRVSRALAFDAGVLYVPCDAGVLVAIDAQRGVELWRVTVGQGSLGTPAVSDGTVYETIGIDDPRQVHQLVAVDLASHAVRWRYETPDNARLYIGAVTTDRVYATDWEGHALHALDAHGGRDLWDFKSQGTNGNQAALAAGVIYLPSADQTVYAVDAATGAELWHVLLRGAPSSLAVIHGRVILGTDTGWLVSIGGSPEPSASP